MQLTGHITPDSLMTLEVYSKYRKLHKAQIIAHRKLRSVQLGEHLNLQFESETTIRYQIQEMLRIEKILKKTASSKKLKPTPRSCPTAATGKPPCCWSTPMSTNASANWRA